MQAATQETSFGEERPNVILTSREESKSMVRYPHEWVAALLPIYIDARIRLGRRSESSSF